MEKPTFKLVGAPCGQHGQYTFYKGIRLSAGGMDRIVAIGDFFFVRIWQDSELVSVGELQLLWTDRVSDQTLVSLRLYFLPENTPDGRNLHGQDEVLAINDKVVVRAEDLLSWASDGKGWRWGLRAVWRGACAPPQSPVDGGATQPLHHTRLDFSDVDREKSAIVDMESPGVVVFSYPRYCRYRALLARLEGIQADWLRDSLVAALGGYAAPTTNTRILYCRDTFEYPELEGHEFVCNELAPKLKGRPRGRRRRASPGGSDGDNASGAESGPDITLPFNIPQTPRRLSLRNGGERTEISAQDAESRREDKAFLTQLRQFHRDGQICPPNDLSLRSLYCNVRSRGGYEVVCRQRLWRELSADQPARSRRHYERYLLPYERHETRNGACRTSHSHDSISGTTVVLDSPTHELTDTETADSKDEMNYVSKPAEELNREFLESLSKEEEIPTKTPVKSEKPAKLSPETPVKLSPEKPVKLSPEKPMKISVKPVEKLVEPKKLFGEEFEKPKEEAVTNHKVNSDKPDSVIGEPQSSSLSSLSALGDKYVNGHDTQKSRPAGRSSLRAVRVKPTRPQVRPPAVPTTTQLGVRSETSGSPHSITNFGIHRPPPPDDDIVEIPYQPKTPEIIDLDEYPESPQSVKKKKLEILKERGLEVTAVPAWPVPPTPLPPLIAPSPVLINPAMQHQIMTQAQLFQMYNILPPQINGLKPPKVIQATSIYGTSGPEKTVYGNPKDPFMPPPHVLLGAPLKPTRAVSATTSPQDILDLTCKVSPSVEIVKVPNTGVQNLSKNYTLLDGKAVVGSNLEITLVNRSQTPNKLRPSQKRSSNGKFVSSKTPTPGDVPREHSPRNYPSASPKKNSIVVPSYQVNPRDNVSPTSSTGSRDSAAGAEPPYGAFGLPALPPLPLSALPPPDARRLQAYRDALASQFRGYSGLLSLSAVTGTPTTKN